MSGFTLDSGALIAFERNEQAVVSLIARAYERGIASLYLPAWLRRPGVTAAAKFDWCDLLAAGTTEIVPLDDRSARSVGQLCGVAGVADVIDASVVWCARERDHAVLTSDPDDLLRLDPTLRIKVV